MNECAGCGNEESKCRRDRCRVCYYCGRAIDPVSSNPRSGDSCPRCGGVLEQDEVEVDNGVMQPCGPLGCRACYWTEGDPMMPHVVRCARSTDGTVATASEIYVDGRLFLSADHVEKEQRYKDALDASTLENLLGFAHSENLRHLAIRTRDEAYAKDRAALDAKWTWWGRALPFDEVCGASTVYPGSPIYTCRRHKGHTGPCAFVPGKLPESF